MHLAMDEENLEGLKLNHERFFHPRTWQSSEPILPTLPLWCDPGRHLGAITAITGGRAGDHSGHYACYYHQQAARSTGCYTATTEAIEAARAGTVDTTHS